LDRPVELPASDSPGPARPSPARAAPTRRTPRGDVRMKWRREVGPRWRLSAGGLEELSSKCVKISPVIKVNLIGCLRIVGHHSLCQFRYNNSRKIPVRPPLSRVYASVRARTKERMSRPLSTR
jgi:hypothetical protein